YKLSCRPFDSACLDAEQDQLAGEYGPRDNREIWSILLVLSRIHGVARDLLEFDAKGPKDLFAGAFQFWTR
ncbi:unnamed protein product, partial [Rhizoctonia solani]